jgi:hypothetical protein
MNEQTPYINNRNVNNVRMQINRKNLNTPYHATTKQASGVLTDYDTFPYPRWFRGVYYSPNPIVSEREAGWRPRHDNCYRLESIKEQDKYPKHCYETACSTTFPCLSKSDDNETLNVMLNKECIVQYR